MTQPQLKLYVIPASHPCECVEAGLQLKELAYKRVDVLPVAHKLVFRALRIPGTTAPALAIDGECMVGSRAILRRLEALQPEPPLLPADPALRARVEEAELWGDEVLQSAARRIGWGVSTRDPKNVPSYLQGYELHMPKAVLAHGAGPTAWAAARFNHADDETVKRDLLALPGELDKVDGWIGEGVIGGESANVGDLQIGSSVRLLMTFGDVRPLIEGRPCVALAERWFPPAKGAIPAGALPPGWVPAAYAAPAAQA
jgi:glutathione S-transferase